MIKNTPVWLEDKGIINEPCFCKEFLKEKPLICVNNIFFDYDGEISEQDISARVYDILKNHITTGLPRKVDNIIKTLKLECRRDSLPVSEDEIHLQNGTLKTDGTWIPEKKFCANRLNVSYDPEIWNESYYPENFLMFLMDMLDMDDITTLQEYLGYCLIPSTKAQSALFIIGNGGEGKSCIGVVMQEIFGSALISGSFQKIETNRFFRYNLQNKLIMLDDDMQLNALPSTGIIKSLITSRIPVEIEAKGKQSEQVQLYARFLCFGNGSPKALYDKSTGFSRRLIIISTKPIPENRKNNPNITDIFITEKEKIFCWMYDGLRRLIANNFKFTISEKTRQNVNEVMKEGCNIPEFLEDSSYISFGNDYSESSQALYSAYCDWCRCNLMTEMNKKAFCSWFKNNAGRLNITPTNHCTCGTRNNVRGYKGIKTHFSSIIL